MDMRMYKKITDLHEAGVSTHTTLVTIMRLARNSEEAATRIEQFYYELNELKKRDERIIKNVRKESDPSPEGQ